MVNSEYVLKEDGDGLRRIVLSGSVSRAEEFRESSMFNQTDSDNKKSLFDNSHGDS